MDAHRLLPHGSTGIAVAVNADGSHEETAVEFERLGYDTLWVAGGQLDSLDRPAELLRATRSVRVATGIVPFGVFDTADIAASWHDLARSHPGRYVLGLGGPQTARPLAPLRRHLAELDAAGVPPHERLLAALGPRKLRIAAERSAGAITLLTAPEQTAAARELLGPGATLAVQQLVVVDDDPVRARGAVRDTITFLARVGGYRASLLRLGFTDRDCDEVSDRLVDAVTAWGSVDTIAERMAAHRAAGADHVAVSLFGTHTSPVDAATAIATRLGLAV